MRAILRLTCSGILLTAIGAFAQTGSPTSAPDVSTIVSRMQTAMTGRNHDQAYTVTREYSLAPEDGSKASKVVAEVNTIPAGKSDYSITEGSGQAEKVVRKILDRETEAINQHSVMPLNAGNYDFAYAGSEPIDGHSCYILQLTPRHDGKDLVKGRIWVDAHSYLVRQLAGTPLKSPSWWIKDLQITLHFKDIEGLWLQDSTTAIAQVRLVGKHTLTSQSLDVRPAVSYASTRTPQSTDRKRTRHANPAMLGAGVFPRH